MTRLSRVWFGYACVIFTIAVATFSIAIARLGVTQHLAAPDLLALRYGIGGLLFLPVLLANVRTAPRKTLALALPLSFVRGWGMSACVLFGLEWAPASHAGAIGPGATALFALVIGALLHRRLPRYVHASAVALIALGVVALVARTYGGSSGALKGDVLFVASGALSASYLVYVERETISAQLGNALVLVASGIVVVPIYLVFFTSRIPNAPFREVLLQGVFQGVLMGISQMSWHRAVLLLGSRRVTMMGASAPVFTIATGHVIAHDPLSFVDTAAIVLVAAGVLLGAFLDRDRVTSLRSSGEESRSPPACDRAG